MYKKCGYMHTHWMFALTVAALDGMKSEATVVSRTRTECSRWSSLLWTEWRARLSLPGGERIGSSWWLWHDADVLVVSWLAGWLRVVAWRWRPVVTCSFRWVILLDDSLWRSGRASLILCRLAGRDPMRLGAAILRVDWLDGRTVRDWHLW
jgi:hypothetical protein